MGAIRVQTFRDGITGIGVFIQLSFEEHPIWVNTIP